MENFQFLVKVSHFCSLSQPAYFPTFFLSVEKSLSSFLIKIQVEEKCKGAYLLPTVGTFLHKRALSGGQVQKQPLFNFFTQKNTRERT